MKGFFKCPRAVFEHPAMLEPGSFHMREALADLFRRANFGRTKAQFGGRRQDVLPGQLVCTTPELAAGWNWYERRVREFLTILEALGVLTVEAENDVLLLTMCHDSELWASRAGAWKDLSSRSSPRREAREELSCPSSPEEREESETRVEITSRIQSGPPELEEERAPHAAPLPFAGQSLFPPNYPRRAFAKFVRDALLGRIHVPTPNHAYSDLRKAFEEKLRAQGRWPIDECLPRRDAA